MNKQTEALKLSLEALSASNDFLFNYHDCEPNNEREVDAYSEVRGNNMKAWEAIRNALSEQPAIPTVITCPFCLSEHVPGWLPKLEGGAA